MSPLKVRLHLLIGLHDANKLWEQTKILTFKDN
jgi:hypothetical protein